MLVDRTDRNARFLIPLLAIFVFAATIIYEWDAITSEPEPNGDILSLDNDISTPASSGGFDAVNQEVEIEGYRVVYSNSTADKKYFFIDFVNQRAINPNIVPHPFLDDTWVIVAQRHYPESQNGATLYEITCNATFQNGTLRCLNISSSLFIKTKSWDMCEGEVEMLNLSRGPHDARVFYGPETPYIIYGSNSKFTCFGQFMQDFRSLSYWRNADFPGTWFQKATELQRPPPYGNIEKNWFVFWDQDGQIHAHYDILPRRAFAKLEIDGSVGEDLGSQAALAGDEKCIAEYAPQIDPDVEKPDGESIHQATNSLSVTLCKRSDPSCEPDEGNTFILTIFQLKRYYHFHSVYDPYVMLFEQKAPFKIHGISTKPFWIHGRWKPNEVEEPLGVEERDEVVEPNELEQAIEVEEPSEQDEANEVNEPDEVKVPDEMEKELNDPSQETIEDGRVKNWNQTEMFYVTSISWKSNKQKYHGYIDDVVFLGFGIEDSMTAGIDVVVGDLLMDLGRC